MDFFMLRADLKGIFSEQQFLDYLGNTGGAVHNDATPVYFGHSLNGTVMTFTISFAEPHFSPELRQMMMEDLARGMAAYIVDVREESIAMSIASKQYSFSSREESRAAEQCCHKLLAGPEEGDQAARQRRKSGIYKVLKEYLQDNRYLDLDGFIAFRLPEYRDKLRETVENAMEEYLLDQQYEEFIHLLQYFVHFQEPLIPLIHLMHKEDHEFHILNEQFSKISVPSQGGVVAQIADQEMEMEDMIVSTLISLSPDRILIHTLEPEAQIILTIRRIFGDRVELCLHCPRCQLFHQEQFHRDQGT
ncbi:putative sporulation protein YtxC [Fontibacillus phaseoli]|uniref:Putative sporulation protein YtxC n=1 Tax=Fontibacillus phaseoli TaxID=1416533 RepID=A0A369BCL8_9BACL|nr:putative sporulation protein YtxC [Fontibacillus phaseoli]RCX17414.1 putative sporulation protein YtxC [Fontibacillus phaseoli]